MNISPKFFQKTIKKEISFIGKGLHKNRNNKITLYPMDINFGLRVKFLKTIIPIHYSFIYDTFLQIHLKKKSDSIYTIEHLLFSLYVLGITNCLIYIHPNSNEIPIFDGSSFYFIKKILCIGIEIQKNTLPIYCLNRSIKVLKKNSFIKYIPFNGIRIDCYFKISHFKESYFQFIVKSSSCLWNKFQNKSIQLLSKARTFGYFEDWTKLKKKGYSYGANSKNTIILYKDSQNKKIQLRYKTEWIRHKILDFISILSFIPYRIFGHFILYQSNHSLDRKFIELLDKQISKKFLNLR